MIEEELSALLPKRWKKSFKSGMIIPTKMRFCNEFNYKGNCTNCNKLVNENQEFEASFNLLQRRAANEFGQLLPYFKEEYESDKLHIHKTDYIIDISFRDCHNKDFHTFEKKCVFDIKLTNGGNNKVFDLTMADGSMTL